MVDLIVDTSSPIYGMLPEWYYTHLTTGCCQCVVSLSSCPIDSVVYLKSHNRIFPEVSSWEDCVSSIG